MVGAIEGSDENREVGNYKNWFARVRFQDDIVVDVSVKKIKTKDGELFKPSTFEEFDPQTVYSVKTAEFDAEGKAQRYFAFIGRLAVSKEDLNNDSRRIRWPSRWPVEPNDEPNNTSQDEGNVHFAEPVVVQRNKAMARLNKKKNRTDSSMQRFLVSSALQLENPLDNISENSNSESSQSCSCPGDNFTLEKVNQLLEERDRRWEVKIQQIIGETVASVITAQFSKFDEKLCKCHWSTTKSVQQWIQSLP